MKSPGEANTDPSLTAGYPAALYDTVSGGGDGQQDHHSYYNVQCTEDVGTQVNKNQKLKVLGYAGILQLNVQT